MEKEKSTIAWPTALCYASTWAASALSECPSPRTSHPFSSQAGYLLARYRSRRREPSEIKQPAEPRPERGSGLPGSQSCTLTTKSPFSTEMSCSKRPCCCQMGTTGRSCIGKTIPSVGIQALLHHTQQAVKHIPAVRI